MSDQVIEDMPRGPLDEYRNQASFDWKKLKMVFEIDGQCLNIKINMWKKLSTDPFFLRPQTTPTSNESKRIAAKRLHRFLQLNFFPSNIFTLPYKKKLKLMMAIYEGMAIAFPDVGVKYAIGVQIVKNILTTLGTERHKHFLDASWAGKVVACVGLTEVSHGSNTKKFRTTAIFDKTTQEFVIHTPDFQAAKCWSGNLGYSATLAIIFAQLITNGQNYGLHAFVVPIRNPKTLLPYPGIIAQDMGEKIGLHGLDNGFMMLDNYRIPKENLLNRTGDVTADGDYESSFSEPEKILGAALENLSLARLGLMQASVNTLIRAITIAVRYAAVRKQFSDGEHGPENSIIEYQLHQWRLFPYVATASVLKIFINSFTEDYLDAVEKTNTYSNRLEDVNNLVSEIHSIVSSAKPLITWNTRDAIQECREACGGFGYLKAAGLGDLRNDHDPSVTYEGDNNILPQQSANWLLKQWTNLQNGNDVTSPLSTCEFLENHLEIRQTKYTKTDDIKDPKYIMKCYEWLITYLVQDISKLMENLQSQGYSRFAAKNLLQVYRISVLSKAYAELNALRYFWKKIHLLPSDLKMVLAQLGILFGLFNLDKHIAYFYQGGFCQEPHMAQEVKNAILELCGQLKPNIVGVVDALAPPDFIINSVLGYCDGKVYEHLENSSFNIDGVLNRPDWWEDIIIADAPDFTKPKSKL